MSGSEIAAEVAAALAEAGEATGDGPFICTIRRAVRASTATPWDAGAATTTDYTVTAIEDVREVRDADGTLIGMTKRTLTVDATGVAPLKSDTIAVGIAPGAVVADTRFEEILAVRPLAPGGVAVLYELDLSI